MSLDPARDNSEQLEDLQEQSLNRGAVTGALGARDTGGASVGAEGA